MQELLDVIKIFTSPVEPVQGQRARVYVVIENKNQTQDFFGKVSLECSKKSFGSEQILSVFKGGQDGVWFDDVVQEGGENNCNVIINDNVGKKTYQENKNFIAIGDTDRDGVPDNTDNDDDNDGLLDVDEVKLGTDPLKKDTDGDGVEDKQDKFPKDKSEWVDFDIDGVGDNADNDDDNDGVTDNEEKNLGSDPKKADSDGDGLSDLKEKELGTSLVNKDTDGDGLDDMYEYNNGTDPKNRDSDNDGIVDSKDPFPLDNKESYDTDKDGKGDNTDDDDDNDGVLDIDEIKYGTDSKKYDTDGDGVSDGDEVKNGTDPLKKDTDGDGANDDIDKFPLNNLYSKDVDGDGLPDELEKKYGISLSVNNANDDEDRDGISTKDELLKYNTDPTKADTDGDNISDEKEIQIKSSPILLDSDSDGINDDMDKYILDNKNGEGDDDNDGIITKVEEVNHLDPKNPNTYFLKDKWSYHIINWWWIYVIVGIGSFFAKKYLEYVSYKNSREEKIRNRKRELDEENNIRSRILKNNKK